MSDAEERYRFISVLTRELPNHSIGAILELAQIVLRQSARHGRLAVALCNGDVDQEEYDRKQERIRQRLTPLLDVLGIGVAFGGDPRGYTVKLQFDSKVSNTWGNDGYGVPGS